MISANFAVAVLTVVLRGLVDRIIASVQTPITKTPLVPPSTSIVLITGTLFLLYNRLIKGRRIHLKYTSPNRRPKILDGRLHKNDSRSLSREPRSTWSPRRFRRRSRSRCLTTNLLQSAKESLELLRNSSSTCSMSTKSSVKCCCKECDTKEASPSVYSVKSETEVADKTDDKTDDPVNEKHGFGDCDWEDHPKVVRRRKRMRSTRKTRSGKIYSSYL